MPRLSAELRSVRVFHSAVCELSSDQYVQDCRNTEKPCQSPDYSLAIGLLENQGLLQAPFSKIDANRDQCQSREEDDWKNPEDNDPDIGIIDVSPDLMRKYEQK